MFKIQFEKIRKMSAMYGRFLDMFHNHCFKVIHGHIHGLYSGSVVTTFCDEEDMLNAIYFQTSEMRSTFDSYPELLLIDATYKLNDLCMS